MTMVISDLEAKLKDARENLGDLPIIKLEDGAYFSQSFNINHGECGEYTWHEGEESNVMVID